MQRKFWEMFRMTNENHDDKNEKNNEKYDKWRGKRVEKRSDKDEYVTREQNIAK